MAGPLPMAFPPMRMGPWSPWNLRPRLGEQRISTVIPPPVPQVLPQPIRFSPFPGPWNLRGSFLPFGSNPIPPPPTPLIIPPNVYPQPMRGGPLAGPWQPMWPVVWRPPIVPSPPLVPPPPPPSGTGASKQFFDRDAGGSVDARLRRNTQKVSTCLNSLIAKDILVQVGDVDWTLDVTAGDVVVGDGLTASMFQGGYGTLA